VIFNRFCSRTPKCNFSSTLFLQSCCCVFQVIHGLWSVSKTKEGERELALPNRMWLRPVLLRLTQNLALIIQCFSWNNSFFQFYILRKMFSRTPDWRPLVWISHGVFDFPNDIIRVRVRSSRFPSVRCGRFLLPSLSLYGRTLAQSKISKKLYRNKYVRFVRKITMGHFAISNLTNLLNECKIASLVTFWVL
jgi:hypothetical protein